MVNRSKSGTSNKNYAVAKAAILATSQTSRFHTDTLTTLSKEIDLKQVNVTIGSKDILVDTHLRLKTGVHYGLVGRNGEGKSTILKAIAEKLIPGVPENLRILLVGQTEIESTDSSLMARLSIQETDLREKGPPSVVEYVLRSDVHRETALWEYKQLSVAAESGSPQELQIALADVKLARADAELHVAQKVASRCSGARGADARKALLEAEAKQMEAFSRVEIARQKSPSSEDATSAEDASEVQALLEEIQVIFDTLDIDSSEAKARTILLGLGFQSDQLDAQFESLSGGWRSRCTLASALHQQPDILILDEPTNYLDIPSVLWLQSYLENLENTTVLLVAHDRDFLDTSTSETIVLRHQKLSYFEGSISRYERAAAKKRKGLLKKQEGLDRKREAIERSITEGAKSAKKTGDDNRAKMVKSRQKKLDERWGAEVNDKGHRFKLNRDMAGYHLTSRTQFDIDDPDPPVELLFPDPDKMRFPGVLCSCADVSFQYTRTSPLVLNSATLTVHPGDRVGIVGKNGEGKSTLVKLLIGQLQPYKGTIERHPRLRLGYYSQHSVEELSQPEISNMSSLERFMTRMKDAHSLQVDEPTARAFLGSFGIRGQTAVNAIQTLSGGQKVRLALASTVYPAPDLLVLDEVSTHLDMDTVVGLIRALRSFRGAIILVSHDRHLVRCVIEGASIIPRLDEDDADEASDSDDTREDKKAGRVYRVGPKGKVRALPGGVDDYVAVIERKLQKAS